MCPSCVTGRKRKENVPLFLKGSFCFGYAHMPYNFVWNSWKGSFLVWGPHSNVCDSETMGYFAPRLPPPTLSQPWIAQLPVLPTLSSFLLFSNNSPRPCLSLELACGLTADPLESAPSRRLWSRPPKGLMQQCTYDERKPQEACLLPVLSISLSSTFPVTGHLNIHKIL